MANRFPLIVDTVNTQIIEIPAGDALDFTSGAVANLAVANLQVTGGSNGQFLRTDGTGNLSWATVGLSSIANGTSNIDIPVASGTINMGVGGVPNVLVVTTTGANMIGTTNLTGNANITGNLHALGNSILGGNANVKITGGANGQVLTTDGAGNLSWTTASATRIANVNTDISIGTANGDITGNIGSTAIPVLKLGNATLNIAIGQYAGQTNQAAATTAIGFNAGQQNQSVNSIAIGYRTARFNQGPRAIAIGSDAGSNAQSEQTVAIGQNAGQVNQGYRAIALGYRAGNSAQGNYSIAIGSDAGHTSQAQNSIILNATGANLDAATANALYIAPIRNANAANVLYYDATTKEVTYGLPSSGGGLPIANGTSNIDIATANGNVTVSVGGTSNVLVVNSTGANVTGNLNVSGISNLGAVGNVRITGGSNGQVLTTNGTGVLSWATPSTTVPSIFYAWTNTVANPTQDGSIVKLTTLTNELYDTNNFWDVANQAFRPTVAGYYRITAQITFNDAGGQVRNAVCLIRKNAIEFARGQYQVDAALGRGFVNITVATNCIVAMNGTGDYVDVAYACNNFNLGIDGILGGSSYTFICGEFIRSL